MDSPFRLLLDAMKFLGLEDEGRIGTELTFEGSKPIERLDFALFTEVAQRGGSGEPITDPEDLCAAARGPGKRTVVRPQRILRAQTRRAQYLRSGQDQVRDRKALRMPNRASDNGTDSRADHVPSGQPGDVPCPPLSIPPARFASRHSGRLVGG